MQNELRAKPRRSHRLSAGLLAGGLLAATLAGSSGCATMGAAQVAAKAQVDPSRLAGLPADQLTQVNEQERGLNEAQADAAAMKHAKEDADNRVKLAEADVDVANSEMKAAQSQLDIAQKASKENASTFGQQSNTPPPTGTQSNIVAPSQQAVASAQKGVDSAELRVKAEQAKLDYLRSLSNIAGSNQNMAEKKVSLSQAELERARFQTLQRVNPAQAQALNVGPETFDASVAGSQAEVSNAGAELARYRADAATKYRDWLALDEQVSQQGQRPTERASVPPPPQG